MNLVSGVRTQAALPPLYRPADMFHSSGLTARYSGLFYAKDTLVRIRNIIDKDDGACACLTIKIFLTPTESKSSGVQHLRIELTTQEDPFFLYTSEVEEGSFLSLKSEQNLLVDFCTFPRKLVELLEACNASNVEEKVARYFLIFSLGGDIKRGEAALMNGSSIGLMLQANKQPQQPLFTRNRFDGTLSIVETNQFKELTHLYLRFHRGSDEATKEHLVNQLNELKLENSQLREGIQAAEKLQETTAGELASLRFATQNSNTESCLMRNSLLSGHQEELKKLNEKHYNDVNTLKTAFIEEKATLDTQFRRQLQMLQRSCEEAKETLESTKKEKLSLERLNEQLCRQLESSRNDLAIKNKAVETIEQKAASLEKNLMEKNISETTETNERIRSLELQLSEKNALLESKAFMNEKFMTQKAEDENTVRDLQEKACALKSDLSSSMHEINRGNMIISKLQSQLRSAKAKLKAKLEECANQETKVSLLEKKVEEMKQKSLEAAEADEKVRRLKMELQQLKKALKEGSSDESVFKREDFPTYFTPGDVFTKENSNFPHHSVLSRCFPMRCSSATPTHTPELPMRREMLSNKALPGALAGVHTRDTIHNFSSEFNSTQVYLPGIHSNHGKSSLSDYSREAAASNTFISEDSKLLGGGRNTSFLHEGTRLFPMSTENSVATPSLSLPKRRSGGGGDIGGVLGDNLQEAARSALSSGLNIHSEEEMLSHRSPPVQAKQE